MSIFGDLETPATPKLVAPARQLSDFSLKVFGAIHDPPSNTVHLRAEAKIGWSDGTASDGMPVAFFLNGKQLPDIKTNDFGIAVFDQNLEKHFFANQGQENELIARIRGAAMEGHAKFRVVPRGLAISKVAHRWNRIVRIQKQWYNAENQHTHIRLEGLTVQLQAQPTGSVFPLDSLPVQVQVLGTQGHYTIIGKSILNTHGMTSIALDRFFIDEPGLANAMTAKPNKKHWQYFATDVKANFSLSETFFFNEILAPKGRSPDEQDYDFIIQHLIELLPLSNNLWGFKVVVSVDGWPEANKVVDVSRQGELFLT